MLRVEDLVAGYSGIPVLHHVDLEIGEGELVGVLGSNGAGKTTLLRTIAGLERPLSGEIRLDRERITGRPPSHICAVGIGHVPENRRVFPSHTVEDNLRLGAYVRRRERAETVRDLARMYEKFPLLGQRRGQMAGSLSGGQQQVLAIAMALMARPRLLMLDEPSLGLAPIVIREVFEEIRDLHQAGSTILLVEQMANALLKVADRAIVLHLGQVLTSGTADELRADESVRAAYLGA